MLVKVFAREDGATVVLPLDLWGFVPVDFEGALVEIGDAELELGCLSPKFVAALGLRGYCVADGDDIAGALHCITQWKEPYNRASLMVLLGQELVAR